MTKLLFSAAIQGSKDFVVPPLHPKKPVFRQFFDNMLLHAMHHQYMHK